MRECVIALKQVVKSLCICLKLVKQVGKVLKYPSALELPV